MSSENRAAVIPAVWILNLLIVFEIIFMISPFSLFYYSAYGSALNFFHQWPETAWLTGFFLPHYTETSSSLLNAVPAAGWILFLCGLGGFIVGAGQIYYHKFFKKQAVIEGIYRFVRHPQYTCFAVMGFGVLLIWPRFIVLIVFALMLFVYYFLARREERECVARFGSSYRSYLERTSMFLPADGVIFKNLLTVKNRLAKAAAIGFLVICVTLVFLSAAFVVRDYSLSQITAAYAPDSATISVALLDQKKVNRILNIALNDVEVQQRMNAVGGAEPARYLNYVVPADWFLPDLPMEAIDEIQGHIQPRNYDTAKYKVLITRAGLFRDPSSAGSDIVKMTYRRTPVALVKVDILAETVLAVETPPEHVKWGDIPTPLF